MSSIGNKEILSRNLKYYIEKSGKDRKELSEIWGFPYSTVTDWINGKKYPRIDRIEIMADFFGILKSDLIEDKTEKHREMQKKNNARADIAQRLFDDDVFLSIVEDLNKLDNEQLLSVRQLLAAFLK